VRDPTLLLEVFFALLIRSRSVTVVSYDRG
jgi:hypothetical protein